MEEKFEFLGRKIGQQKGKFGMRKLIFIIKGDITRKRNFFNIN